MIIKSVSLKNFRNYETLKIDLDQDTNILFGDNAQGKTNILEALYVSGTTKSHKGSKDREMIRFGEEEAHICTLVQKNDREYEIDIHLKKSRTKGIAVNKVPIRKASELFGILHLVFFSPEDLNIIKNGPAERRRFLDVELCQLDKIYLHNLTKYNKALMQRNKLLKDICYQPELKPTLPLWDEQLILYGCKVVQRRREFMSDLVPVISEIHRKISGEKEEIAVNYEPDVSEGEYEAEMNRFMQKDLKTGSTSVGPHRDDIRFSVNNVDIRRYGSQGQQRTAALSLKLSEIELVKTMIHDTPVLLLDDVMSELDSSRQNYILDNINDVQTVITCTGLDDFIKNRFCINKIFRIKEGHAEEMNWRNL